MRTLCACVVGVMLLISVASSAFAQGRSGYGTEPVTVTSPADSSEPPNIVHQQPAWTMSPPVVKGSDPKGIRTIRILPETPTASYFVQVSAQKTEVEAKAAFAALQARFPALLGEREAEFRQVNLGDRGVYHRALVGPFETAGAANDMCGAIKAAGGQCIVQRN